MKKIILGIFYILNIAVHAQQWEWAEKANSTTAAQVAKKICYDNSGNVIALGSNQGKATYGTTILDTGSFVVKYDSTGGLLWAMEIKGNPIDINCDVFGNIYVLGNFYGNITLGSFTLTSNGSSDIYFTKLSSTGLVIWAKSFGGLKYDEASAFATDNTGNSYLTGLYNDSISFGNILLKDSTGSGQSNFFLTKINSTGNLQWANSGPQNFSSSSSFYYSGTCVKLNKAQDIYVIGQVTWPNNPCPEFFFLKYNTVGVLQLNKTPGGGDWSCYSNKDFAIDDSANVFRVWNTDTHYGYFPALMKYDSLINYKWQRDLSDLNYGPNYDLNCGISSDDSGNVYIAGNLGSAYMQVDSLQLCNQWLVRKGGTDILIGKFDRTGNCVWFKSAGGKNNEGGQMTMSVDRNGNCYLMGIYNISGSGNMYNDTVSFDNTILANDGNWEQLFVAKLAPGNAITSTQVFANLNSEIKVYPNPSCGVFNVSLNQRNTETEICIYDILGSCLLNKNYGKNVNPKIDLSDNSKGIYFIEIVSDNKKEIRKIILE